MAERFVGTVRRELLNHAIVLDDEHLPRWLLSEYLAYYHGDRTHLGVEKDAPVARPVELRPADAAAVHAHRRVGGLYHRYVWAAPRRRVRHEAAEHVWAVPGSRVTT